MGVGGRDACGLRSRTLSEPELITCETKGQRVSIITLQTNYSLQISIFSWRHVCSSSLHDTGNVHWMTWGNISWQCGGTPRHSAYTDYWLNELFEWRDYSYCYSSIISDFWISCNLWNTCSYIWSVRRKKFDPRRSHPRGITHHLHITSLVWDEMV